MADKKNTPVGGAPRADFSDVQSGSSTTAQPTQPMQAAQTGSRSYTGVAGDTLSKIAKRELGDANKWHAIFEANRDKLKDPDKIYPDQVLTIPSDA